MSTGSGFMSTDETTDAIYLRGVEERQHHSLVLHRSDNAAARHLGFKVASEEDLDRAAAFFERRGLRPSSSSVPYQGRTLHAVDPFGMPIELYFSMEKRERLLQSYGHYKGVHPQRIDHFNCFTPDVQGALDFYTDSRLPPDRVYRGRWPERPHRRPAGCTARATCTISPSPTDAGRACITSAYWAPTAMHIIHLCDLMATTGYLANMERGPGRHGISNAFFLYVRDPDGHRIELYTSDYQTIDPDHEPIRWSLRDPHRQTLWGQPAPRSWFEEGSEFAGTAPREPLFEAKVIIAN